VTEERDSEADAEIALASLAEAYRTVILRFFSLKDLANAEDLAHSFLTRWLQQRSLGAFRRRPNTSFRKYLTTAMHHFWVDTTVARHAGKRGEGIADLPLDTLGEDSQWMLPEIEPEVAAVIDREVALTVHDRALATLRDDHANPAQRLRFDVLGELLLFDAEQPAHAEAGRKLDLAPNALQQALHRFRQSYFDAFRAAVAAIARPEEVDVEMRHLVTLLPSALAECRGKSVARGI
jgi:DNA-directed RNA polymerase specialized sigma24 family protein